jgi:hypothetical protein
MDPNNLGIQILDFHPTKPDWLIFTGSEGCDSTVSQNCKAVAYYSTDHGRRWKKIEEYVRTCAWARDARLKIDEREIICESYKNKKGSQNGGDYNPIELIAGSNWYSKKIKLFDSVVGFASFSEYLLVAQVSARPPGDWRLATDTALNITAQRDGRDFDFASIARRIPFCRGSIPTQHAH